MPEAFVQLPRISDERIRGIRKTDGGRKFLQSKRFRIRLDLSLYVEALDASDALALDYPQRYERVDPQDRTLLNGIPADWLADKTLTASETQTLVSLVCEGGARYLEDL